MSPGDSEVAVRFCLLGGLYRTHQAAETYRLKQAINKVKPGTYDIAEFNDNATWDEVILNLAGI